MNFQILSLDPGLYLVATPIGAARDITLRALDVLASADVLAAEDTRSLRHLLEIHGVPLSGRRILAYHDHSGPGARKAMIEAMLAGKSVAYASEAGMPLVADPGFDLVRTAVEAEQMVTCAPGPSAALAALVLSGLPSDTFLFAGFLPNSRQARRARLLALAEVPATLVFYESPKRIGASLQDMGEVLGQDRQAALARELTKKFEETRRASLGELSTSVEQTPPRGEIVVIVDRGRSEKISDDALDEALATALEGLSVRDAADMVAKAHDLPRRQVYQRALKLGRGAS